MELSKTKYVHVIIMLVLALGIPMLPCFGAITPYGMKVIGVFAAVLYGWIAFDLMWSSIFGFAMLGVTGLMSPLDAFVAGLGDSMISTVLLSLAFAVGIAKAGVAELMSNWLLKRKLFQRSPWLLVSGIILTGFLIGCFGPSMAGIVILWVVTLNIADICNYKKDDALINFIMVMIVLATMAGANVMPYKAQVLIFLAYLQQTTDLTFSNGGYMITVFVYALSITLVMILLAKFILKLDATKFTLPEEVLHKIETEPITKCQLIGLSITAVYSLALILPSFITFPGSKTLTVWGVPGCSAIAILIMAIIKVDGKALIKIQDIFRDLDWTLLLLLAVTFPIAACLRAADSGVMATLMQVVAPMVSSLGLMPFIIVSIIILGIFTQFIHNVVLGALFMPFLLPLCINMGGPVLTFWLMMFLILNTAYCTPGGSLQAAMVYGNENIERKYAYRYTLIFFVVSLVLLHVVAMPVGNLFL